MKNAPTLLTLAALAIPQTSFALGTATWPAVCSQAGVGIAAFSTCASSEVNVDADGWVTLKLWNLSGLPGSNSNPNAIFTAIGLGASSDGINRGVASQYYSPGPPSQVQTNFSGDLGSGYVQFRFRVGHVIKECPVNRPNCTNNQKVEFFVSEDFDPAKVRLGLHAQGFPGGGGSSGYSCAASNDPNCRFLETTHAPEPMTMTLLASGLVGLGCVGWIRRRRETRSAPRS